MRLDAVENVMEVEESFGITIPEDRAGNVRTVGGFYAIVLDLTKDITRDNNACVTAATFRSLRRHLIPQVADARRIRPSWKIADTLPLRGRRRLWARLGTEMDLRMPPRQRPHWMTLMSILLTATASWFCYATFAADNASGLGAFSGLLTIVFVGLVLASVTAANNRNGSTNRQSNENALTVANGTNRRFTSVGGAKPNTFIQPNSQTTMEFYRCK